MRDQGFGTGAALQAPFSSPPPAAKVADADEVIALAAASTAGSKVGTGPAAGDAAGTAGVGDTPAADGGGGAFAAVAAAGKDANKRSRKDQAGSLMVAVGGKGGSQEATMGLATAAGTAAGAVAGSTAGTASAVGGQHLKAGEDDVRIDVR